MKRRNFLLSLCGTALTALLTACSRGKKASGERGPDQYKVRLETTKGDVILLVHRDWSPLGADHFYELTKMGFYNNVAFFRVVKGFIIQWGINGNPKLNGDWSKITIPDDPPKVPNKVGTVVFAKTGEPNSRSTQLFINLGDNSASLDPQGFTPFGEVIQGLETVMHLNAEYEEQPDQGAIADVGTPYLEEHFPRLDYVKKTTILP